jgi:phospholipase/carboxylesterase
VTIEAALRRPDRCAALLIYTGTVRNRDRLAQEITARPPTMLIHGALDEVVPVAQAERTARILTEHDLPVQMHICAGIGHTLNEEGALVGAQFIAEQLYGELWKEG